MEDFCTYWLKKDKKDFEKSFCIKCVENKGCSYKSKAESAAFNNAKDPNESVAKNN